MVFDRVLIQFMDRFVWCLLLLVSANCMIRITTAHHEKVLVEAQTTSEASSSPSSSSTTPESATESKESESRSAKVAPQGKSQLLENIFNIPIATLKAVNDLVQSIVSTVHVAGGQIDPRTHDSGRTAEKAKQ